MGTANQDCIEAMINGSPLHFTYGVVCARVCLYKCKSETRVPLSIQEMSIGCSFPSMTYYLTDNNNRSRRSLTHPTEAFLR